MKTIAKTALAAALLLGTSLSSAYAVERGGTLTYGRYADSLFLDPVLNDANVDIWILSNLYDTLLLPTDDGQSVKAGLATDWKVADDGLSVALTLRDGIKFSDGSPITAEDVKWSLTRASTPDNGIWQFLVASIDSVSTESSRFNRPRSSAITPAKPARAAPNVVGVLDLPARVNALTGAPAAKRRSGALETSGLPDGPYCTPAKPGQQLRQVEA